MWKYRFHNKNQHNHYFLFQINHLHKITNTIRRLFLPSVIHVITINFLTHVNNYEKRMMLNAHNCVAKRKKSHERSRCLFTKKNFLRLAKWQHQQMCFLWKVSNIISKFDYISAERENVWKGTLLVPFSTVDALMAVKVFLFMQHDVSNKSAFIIFFAAQNWTIMKMIPRNKSLI